MPDNEILINLDLTPAARQLYDGLSALIANTKPIEIGINLSPQAGTSLTNSIQTTLNSQIFELKNITVNTQNIVAQIQRALDNASFKIDVAVKGSGTVAPGGGSVGSSSSLGAFTQPSQSFGGYQSNNSFVNTLLSGTDISRGFGGTSINEFTAPRTDLGTSEIDRAIQATQRARQAALSRAAKNVSFLDSLFTGLGGPAGKSPSTVNEFTVPRADLGSEPTPFLGPYSPLSASPYTYGNQSSGFIGPLDTRSDAYNLKTAAYSKLSDNPGAITYNPYYANAYINNAGNVLAGTYFNTLSAQAAQNSGYIYGGSRGGGFYGPTVPGAGSGGSGYIFTPPSSPSYFNNAVYGPTNPNYIYGGQSATQPFGPTLPGIPVSGSAYSYGGPTGLPQGPTNPNSPFNLALGAAYGPQFVRQPTFKDNLLSENTLREVGTSALFGIINGDPARLLGGTLGAGIGGGITGTTSGARIGGAAGIGIFSAVEHALGSFIESVKGAAEAGLTFQRSILGISGTLSQSSQFVDESGNPLDIQGQVTSQKSRAKGIQLAARAQAAQVGIGGEAESALVQAILTGLGTRGIQLNEGQAGTVTARLGAALNIFAPELANQPNVVRRDIYDIFSGVGQASRTAVGSRIPQVVEQLRSARTGEDVEKATESLDKLILVFKNSGDAITQIQRFNAVIDITRTNFGEAIVDRIGPAIGQLVDTLNSPQATTAFNNFGKAIGNIVSTIITGYDELIKRGASVAGALSAPREGATPAELQTRLKTQGQLGSQIDDLIPGVKLLRNIPGFNKFLDNNSIGRFLVSQIEGGVETGQFNPDVQDEIDAQIGTGRFKKPLKPSVETLQQNVGDKFLTQAGLESKDVKSYYDIVKGSPEYQTLSFLQSSDYFTNLYDNPDQITDSRLTGDVLRGRIIQANQGAIKGYAAIDQSNINNATTIGSQIGAVAGSNIGQRLDRAQENVRIAQDAYNEAADKGTNDEFLQAKTALEAQKRALDEVNKASFDLNLKFLDLSKTAINLNTAFENIPDKIAKTASTMEELQFKAADFGNELQLALVSNEEKLISEAKKTAEAQGGVLTDQQTQALQARGIDVGQVYFGDVGGLSQEFRDQYKAGFQFNQALLDTDTNRTYARFRGQAADLRIQARNNEAEQDNNILEGAELGLKLGKTPNFGNTGNLNSTLQSVASSLTKLGNNFDLTKLSDAIVQGLAKVYGNSN